MRDSSGGFLAATVRTLTAGQHLIMRSSYPLKVFADAVTAAPWIAARGELEEHDVRVALTQVRPF